MRGGALSAGWGMLIPPGVLGILMASQHLSATPTQERSEPRSGIRRVHTVLGAAVSGFGSCSVAARLRRYIRHTFLASPPERPPELGGLHLSFLGLRGDCFCRVSRGRSRSEEWGSCCDRFAVQASQTWSPRIEARLATLRW